MATSNLEVADLAALLYTLVDCEYGFHLPRRGVPRCFLREEWVLGGHVWRIYAWDSEKDAQGEKLGEGSFLQVLEIAKQRAFLHLL